MFLPNLVPEMDFYAWMMNKSRENVKNTVLDFFAELDSMIHIKFHAEFSVHFQYNNNY